MGRPRILDTKIMSKIAKKTGKRDIIAVNRMVSGKAAKLGISAEAALILIAKEHGIGTSTYQRSLEVSKQDQVRDALPIMFATRQTTTTKTAPKSIKLTSAISRRSSLKLAIEYLIQDDELRGRCADLLLASSKFDRAINQATLVLEERIRNKALPPTSIVGEPLVNFAFKDDLTKTILQVAGGNVDDQRGFVQIFRGLVPTFRNKTHHHVIDTFSREDAMRICGFIDVLLRVVDSSTKVK